MSTYLERYESGEHEAVWRELLALGAAVRDPAVYDDARAVARETMRRVRANAELVTARLGALGYEFAYPDAALGEPSAELTRRLDTLEREVGPLPLSVRAFYEQVGSVCWMGSYPGLSTLAAPPDLGAMMRGVSDTYAQHFGAPPPPAPAAPAVPPGIDPALAARLQLAPGAAAMLGQASQLIRMLSEQMQTTMADAERVAAEGGPPSPAAAQTHQFARALAAQMGLVGPPEMGLPEPAAHRAEDVVSDPLVVEPPEYDDVEAYLVEDDEVEGSPLHFIDIAPDELHKAGISGSGPYQIRFPNPAADAEVEGSRGETFVEHLRESFRWGGFPGLRDRPRPALLDGLVAGLVPF